MLCLILESLKAERLLEEYAELFLYRADLLPVYVVSLTDCYANFADSSLVLVIISDCVLFVVT